MEGRGWVASNIEKWKSKSNWKICREFKVKGDRVGKKRVRETRSTEGSGRGAGARVKSTLLSNCDIDHVKVVEIGFGGITRQKSVESCKKKK